MREDHPQSHATQVTDNKRLYLHFHKAHSPQTYQGGDSGWRDHNSKVTRYFDRVVTWQIKVFISLLAQGLWTPNLAGWWHRVRGTHPQSHLTLWLCDHVTNQKYFISFTRCKVHKLSRVVIRMKDPPNMSCNTLITPSRGNCSAGRVHLFQFLLKLSPKNR